MSDHKPKGQGFQAAKTQSMKASKTQPLPTLDDGGPTVVRPRQPDDHAPSQSDWALVAYAGVSLGRIFPLRVGTMLLGRSPEADIALLDAEVSRHHSRVHWTNMDDGSVTLSVEDLGSTNGTLLNGKRIQGTAIIRAGDRLTVGGHVLKVVALDHLERAFHETLLDQSTKDSLTGLANRSATLSELKTRFELAMRHHRPLSVIMVDLDHFKKINDTLGHGAGDFVLRSFGERVLARLRGADLAGRIGGEEFLLVLSETDTEGALHLAERIRSAMADSPHLLPNGPLEATCSVGVAERIPSDRSPGDLMGRADAALYAAKTSGRNRVVAAPAEGS